MLLLSVSTCVAIIMQKTVQEYTRITSKRLYFMMKHCVSERQCIRFRLFLPVYDHVAAQLQHLGIKWIKVSCLLWLSSSQLTCHFTVIDASKSVIQPKLQNPHIQQQCTLVKLPTYTPVLKSTPGPGGAIEGCRDGNSEADLASGHTSSNCGASLLDSSAWVFSIKAVNVGMLGMFSNGHSRQ